VKHSHCSYCGRAFAAGQPWPRQCEGCGQISYLNPLPVAVLLLPTDGGLLCVRRAIEPGKGELSLPGGFIDVGETWQEAAVRELREEAGVVVAADEVELFAVHSAAAGFLLVFGLARPRTEAELPPFTPTEEASARVVLRGPAPLAFPLHTRAVRDYFGRLGA
jgi:ADP-ribose pyrophosphatase YjhB (NUDIX family)